MILGEVVDALKFSFYLSLTFHCGFVAVFSLACHLHNVNSVESQPAAPEPTAASVSASGEQLDATTPFLPTVTNVTVVIQFTPTVVATNTQEVPGNQPAALLLKVAFGGFSSIVPGGLASSVRSNNESSTGIGKDLPIFGQYPNRLVFRLNGYTIGEHMHEPRIETYPVDNYARYSPAIVIFPVNASILVKDMMEKNTPSGGCLSL